jgi:hypothetical protein
MGVKEGLAVIVGRLSNPSFSEVVLGSCVVIEVVLDVLQATSAENITNPIKL